MNRLYISLIIIGTIILVIGIFLIIYFSLKKPKILLKYGDNIKIKMHAPSINDNYYWSINKSSDYPWIYGSSYPEDFSVFQILDSSGNTSNKNIKDGDMIKLKFNNDIIRYPLIYHEIVDCAPFWNTSGLPQNIKDTYMEDLFQIQLDSKVDGDLIFANTPVSLLQNKKKRCGSINIIDGSGNPPPICKDSDVADKFMFLTSTLDEYYVDNCNYGAEEETRGNCSLCEKNKMSWVFQKV